MLLAQLPLQLVNVSLQLADALPLAFLHEAPDKEKQEENDESDYHVAHSFLTNGFKFIGLQGIKKRGFCQVYAIIRVNYKVKLCSPLRKITFIRIIWHDYPALGNQSLNIKALIKQIFTPYLNAYLYTFYHLAFILLEL